MRLKAGERGLKVKRSYQFGAGWMQTEGMGVGAAPRAGGGGRFGPSQGFNEAIDMVIASALPSTRGNYAPLLEIDDFH